MVSTRHSKNVFFEKIQEIVQQLRSKMKKKREERKKPKPWTQKVALRPSGVLQLALQLLPVARHVGFPAFCLRLKFSSCRRIISFLQSSPCLQRILPRVGDNVVRLITRQSHERCMHLLHHKLQVLFSSVHNFRRLLSCPLQHHLRLLDHTSEERLRLLRPLSEILLSARELLRTTKTFHINETRSVLPNLRLIARTASASPDFAAT